MDLENHNRGPEELNHGSRVLGSLTRSTIFLKRMGCCDLDFLENKKLSTEVLSVHSALF